MVFNAVSENFTLIVTKFQKIFFYYFFTYEVRMAKFIIAWGSI
jgi:hypothetical protein